MIRSAAARPRGAKSATGVLGLVLTRWRLASTDAGRNEALGLHELERRRLQAGTLSGFVEYLCLATAVLLSLVHHGIMDPRALLKILELFEVELSPVEDGAPERSSVRTLITRWRHQCEVDILPVDCLMITPLLVGPILSGKASICHVVGVGQRVCRKRLLVHMPPTSGTLKRFRESSLQQRRSNFESHLALERPQWKQFKKNQKWAAAATRIKTKQSRKSKNPQVGVLPDSSVPSQVSNHLHRCPLHEVVLLNSVGRRSCHRASKTCAW